MNKNKKLSDMTIGELEELIKSLLPNNIYQYQQFNPDKFLMPYVGDGIPPYLYLSNDKPCKVTTHTEPIQTE